MCRYLPPYPYRVGALLAWSLHAADERLRKALVPTAVAPPKQLAAALAHALGRRVPKKRRVLIEVVLIDGVNDGLHHADAIAELLQPIHAVAAGHRP